MLLGGWAAVIYWRRFIPREDFRTVFQFVASSISSARGGLGSIRAGGEASPPDKTKEDR